VRTRTRQSTIRTALAGVIGNVLEWFDIAVYGFFVSAIGEQFFPRSSPAAQRLHAFAGFAVGFVGRPFGSLVFGVVGDPIGRRALLTLSVAMMGASTLLIGLLPTYAQIGVAAPVALVALRLIQRRRAHRLDGGHDRAGISAVARAGDAAPANPLSRRARRRRVTATVPWYTSGVPRYS
jgi:MFS family permease